MSIGKRLEEERRAKGYRSQNSLADVLDISYPTISRWENDATAIPSDKCATLAQLGLDIMYILTGEKNTAQKEPTVGDTEKEEPPNINELENVNRRRSAVFVDNDEHVFVPLYDVEVSAGSGALLSSENIKSQLAFTKYSLRRKGLQPDQLACVQGKGDSMQPTISEGDTLMIDLRAKDADGGIFVLRVGDALYVKRLMREKDGIRVISDNKVYPEWILNESDEYEIIGKRVWQARWD